ncbi:hypothetical protein ACJX0J_016210, partial [Zea mays]
KAILHFGPPIFYKLFMYFLHDREDEHIAFKVEEKEVDAKHIADLEYISDIERNATTFLCNTLFEIFSWLVIRKFYSEVPLNGGREIADEDIRQNEKDSHTALEETRKVEEATERERLISMFNFLYREIFKNPLFG